MKFKNAKISSGQNGLLDIKIKQLFIGKGYAEEDALLFIEHALQELNDDKPTIH